MRRSFAGAFLGSLLQPLLTRLGLKLSKGLLLVLVVAFALFFRWWQQQPTWVHLLIVVAVAAFVLRAPLMRRAHVPAGWRRTEPRPLDQQVTFLYRWFDVDDRLLYVGISNDLARRTGQHMADKPWMDEAVRCDATSYPNRQAALDAEEHAIYSENPIWNVVHNRGPVW